MNHFFRKVTWSVAKDFLEEKPVVDLLLFLLWGMENPS